MIFGATIILTAGNQNAVVDSETNSEALNISQGLLEDAQAKARKDFNLVNPYASSSVDGFYTSEVGVVLSDDFLMKTVTATTSWNGQYGRERYVTLTTLIANFTNTAGANTCDSTVVGEDWSSPQVRNGTTDFGVLTGLPGTYPITDIDAYQNRLYVTTNNPSGPASQDTLFVFDSSDPDTLSQSDLRTYLDTDNANSTGLGAVVAVKKGATTYALVANRSSVTKGQFQVVKTEPLPASVLKSLPVPGLTAGFGNSLFYKDGYAYLGLTATGGQGKEFNIIDVHDIDDPAWRGAVTSGNHDVNAIFAKEGFAFIGTPGSAKFSTVDIGDPVSPSIIDTYAGSGNTGKSVYGVGDMLYVGTTAGGAQYEVVDASNPASLVSEGITKSFSGSVDGIIVRDSLAFVLTKTSLEIINATSTATVGSFSLPTNSTSYEPTFDCEGDTIYIGAYDSTAGQSVLYAVGPS